MRNGIPRTQKPMGKASEPTVFFSAQAIRAVPWMILGKTITFFVYFTISVLIVRGLTPYQYGEYSLCKAIAEYFVRVAALGLNFTLLRFIPELILAKNLAGIKRLLTRTAAVQILLLMVLAACLYLAQGYISAWLKINAEHFVAFIMLLALAATLRNFGNDVSTAIYQSRFLTVLSVAHSVLWLSLLTAAFHWGYGIEGVLLSTSLAGITIGLWNICRLVLHFNGLQWRSPPEGIGRKRVLRLAIPMLLNDLINILIQNYTEVFFLGFFFTPVLVGFYDVGYQLPMLVITFIPLAIQSLFASAFGEAYSKSKESLPELVKGYFQILTVVTVPTAFFGFFFATSIVTLVYGEKMLPAAQVVGIFSLFHMVTQFSIPPSMAINAMEKTVNTLWFGLLELVVAIVLDIFLIREFGLHGAVAAVVCSFILTLPLRIWLIRSLVGGVYFPATFFVRILLLCVTAGAAVAYGTSLLPTESQFLKLCFAFAAYGTLLLAGVKGLRLVRAKDIARFKSIGVKKLDRLISFFVEG